MRLALVLWSGNIGGAERVTASLARQLRRDGVDARIVFVCTPGPLARDLVSWGVPFTGLRLSRGMRVLYRARGLARLVEEAGSDGAVLNSGGYLAAALRIGGYKQRVVAVEHGSLIRDEDSTPSRRAFRRLLRSCGTWAIDAEVAVSDYVMKRLVARSHADKLLRIYNGVDSRAYLPAIPDVGSRDARHEGKTVIGYGGRLVGAKGAQDLLVACGDLLKSSDCVLSIAGDGPQREELEGLAAKMGIRELVEFRGWVDDMAGFWQACDIAVVPSVCEEAFGMVAIEAMACGKPVVASDRGALPEVVVHGQTGLIYPAGSLPGLRDALRRYASDRNRRLSDGRAGRERCVAVFDIQACAAAYRELFV